MGGARKVATFAAVLGLAFALASAPAVVAYAVGIVDLATHGFNGKLVSETVYGAIGDGYFLIDRYYERSTVSDDVYMQCFDVVDKDGNVTISTYAGSGEDESEIQLEDWSAQSDTMLYSTGKNENSRDGLIRMSGEKVKYSDGTHVLYNTARRNQDSDWYFGALASKSGLRIDAYNSGGNVEWSYTDPAVTASGAYLETYGGYLKVWPYDSGGNSTYPQRIYKVVSGGCELMADVVCICSDSDESLPESSRTEVYVRVSNDGTITLDNTTEEKVVAGIKFLGPNGELPTELFANINGNIVKIEGEYETGEVDEDDGPITEDIGPVFVNVKTGAQIEIPETHSYSATTDFDLYYSAVVGGCVFASYVWEPEDGNSVNYAELRDENGTVIKKWENGSPSGYSWYDRVFCDGSSGPLYTSSSTSNDEVEKVTLYGGQNFNYTYSFEAADYGYFHVYVRGDVYVVSYAPKEGEWKTIYLDSSLKEIAKPADLDIDTDFRFTAPDGRDVYVSHKYTEDGDVYYFADQDGKTVKIGNYTSALSSVGDYWCAGTHYTRDLGTIYYVTDGKGNYGAVKADGTVYVPIVFSEYYDRQLSGSDIIAVKYHGKWCTYDLSQSDGGYSDSGGVPNVPLTELKAGWFKLSGTSFVFNGKAIKPAVTNTAGLSEGKDYSVKYASGCKKAGKYKVTITGKDGYTGTVTKAFIIKPAKVTNVKAKALARNRAKVTWSNVKGKAASVTGYTVRLYVGKKVVKKYNVKGAAKKSATITAPKKYLNKRCKVTVAAYKTIDGKKVYGAEGVAKAKVRIKK